MVRRRTREAQVPDRVDQARVKPARQARGEGRGQPQQEPIRSDRGNATNGARERPSNLTTIQGATRSERTTGWRRGSQVHRRAGYRLRVHRYHRTDRGRRRPRDPRPRREPRPAGRAHVAPRCRPCRILPGWRRNAGSAITTPGCVSTSVATASVARRRSIASRCRWPTRSSSRGVARVLEPMSSADRKIVHDALSEVEGIGTRSEGDDPYRRVVITPAND